MTTTIPVTHPAHPARPDGFDPTLRRAAAEKIVGALIQHTLLEENERADAVESVVKHARYGGDGYDIARQLESDGWCPNAEMVVILDGYASHIGSLRDAAVKEWVIAHGISAPWPDGTRVRARMSGGMNAGTVTGSDQYRAAYLVKQDGETNETRRFIIPYEACTRIDDASACMEASEAAK